MKPDFADNGAMLGNEQLLSRAFLRAMSTINELLLLAKQYSCKKRVLPSLPLLFLREQENKQDFLWWVFLNDFFPSQQFISYLEQFTDTAG